MMHNWRFRLIGWWKWLTIYHTADFNPFVSPRDRRD